MSYPIPRIEISCSDRSVDITAISWIGFTSTVSISKELFLWPDVSVYKELERGISLAVRSLR